MKKKVVAMFLAAVMALSLVACGSKSDNGGSGDASGTETIKLGGVGPLTGGYANYGLSVQHGAELAVKEINAAGGVNGKQLELSFQDSQGDPESAVAAYGKLMDWGMNVSLGAVLSGETASVVAAAKADDVLVMETTGSADKCIDGNDKAFRICFYDSYQGTAAADYLTDNALATEVGVFYQSDNDYSVGLYNAFVAECQNTGVTIKETQTFTTATSTDFSTQVNALASSGVKVVFIPIYAEEASTFLTQAKGKFADDVYFFGADGLDGILGKVSQDVTIADNVLMMTPFAADSADPKVQAFVKAYQDAYNLPALRREGGTGAMQRNDDYDEFDTNIDKRAEPGEHLRADRAGLHHGLRYRQNAELRPRRRDHGGRIQRHCGGGAAGTVPVGDGDRQHRGMRGVGRGH